jgi:hypothetical protein
LSTPPRPESPDRPERTLHCGRAIVIGCLLIPAGVFFGAYAYLIVQAIIWAQTSLQLGAVFSLLLVILGSRGLGLVHRRLRLQQHELLIVYVMMSLAGCVSGVSMVPFLVNTMAAGHYYATAENRWEDLISNLPRWFGPHDESIIKAYYEGTGTLYSAAVLQEWGWPLVWWGAMIVLIVLGSVFLVNLFGRQWVVREKLTFPLVQLPLEMSAESAGGAFWRNRLMWIGFAAAGILESVDFVNYLYPSFPTVWLKARPMNQYFTAPPWTGMRPFSIAFYPFMIGIGWLLTLESSLSCWLFYLLSKLANVACVASGFRGSSMSGLARLPLVQEQGCGAMLGLVAAAIWVARGQLWQAVRDPRGRDEAGFIHPRTALIGFAAVLALLTAMASVAGLVAHVGFIYYVLYFAFVLAIARIVAETGAGWTMVGNTNPHGLLIGAFGTRAWTPRGLAVFSYLDWQDSDYRDTPLVHLLAALKMREEAGIPRLGLLGAVLSALGVGLVSAIWAHLHIYYSFGAATAKVRGWYTAVGQTPYRRLASWSAYALPTDWAGLGGAAFGFLFALLLGTARQRVPGWPFHPIGYAIANTPSMDYLWMPFLVAWLLKLLVLRYGSISTYRKLVPLFLGAILGDLAVPALWGLYGTIIGKQMYMFFPH